MEYVCAKCGNEQDTTVRCEKCAHPVVVAISFAESTFGPEWRKAFIPGEQISPESLPPGTTLIKNSEGDEEWPTESSNHS